jgi:hypothetical protein
MTRLLVTHAAMHREECVTCGAVLQKVRIDDADVLRCPWANDDIYQAIELGRTTIDCNWPLGRRRIPGGIRVESVA